MTISKEFSLSSSTCEPLTKDIAEQFRDMDASPTERELDPKRVIHLRKKMDEGLGVTFHWAVANIDGNECRMNGQHSSTMLAEMNGDFPDDLYAHIDRYDVKSVKGLALLFRQFDDRKSSRGVADIAGAYQGLYKEINEVPRKSAALGLKGLAWHEANIVGGPVPKGDDVWTMFDLKKNYPFLIWFGELMSSKTNEMKKTELVAAIYGSFMESEVKAKEFWTWVAKGGDFEPDHPATRLDEWLMAAKEISDVKKRFKPAHYYQAGMFCFNAFIEGREVRKVNCKTDKGYLLPVA